METVAMAQGDVLGCFSVVLLPLFGFLAVLHSICCKRWLLYYDLMIDQQGVRFDLMV